MAMKGDEVLYPNSRPSRNGEHAWRPPLATGSLFISGKAEMIFNPITLRLAAEDGGQYLINPYGLHYRETTANNLMKIDAQGRKLDDSPYDVNPAGFVIHSAIHSSRADAHCIMHTHTTAGVAVACKVDALRYDNFHAALVYGRVAQHNFQGVSTNADESHRLVRSLGTRDILLLRNHDLLVCVLRRNADQYASMALGQEPGRRMFDAILRHVGIRYADLA
jgi:ribulose-5-phosphate 4-epimerase/fuculose-1-phosphate aldolase